MIRDQRGQTAAEYMGVLLLVAVIIGTLAVSGLPGAIADAAARSVCTIAGGCTREKSTPPRPERVTGANPADDRDGDGIGNARERALGTDPNTADSDGDGLTDGEERRAGADPTRADTDGDGLPDAEEHDSQGLMSPTDADSDDDGLSDAEEIAAGTAPDDADSDGELGDNGDGLTDAREIELGTDPTRFDTDGDGKPDGMEVREGSDPLKDERGGVQKLFEDLVLDDPIGAAIGGGGAGRGAKKFIDELISLGERKLPRIAGAKSAKEAASIRRRRIEALRERLRDERGELDLSKLGRRAAGTRLSPKVKRLAEQHLTGSGKTVLGSFAGPKNYIAKAKERGASYFDIGDEWNRLTPAQRTAANDHFLDRISAARDQVLLSTPKTRIEPGTALAHEVQYLVKQKNYRWVNQWSLKPR